MDQTKPEKIRELLDELFQSAGLCYLSDLHNLHNVAVVRQAIGQIHAEKYSLREWREAACYILRTDSIPGETAEEVKNAIRLRLSK